MSQNDEERSGRSGREGGRQDRFGRGPGAGDRGRAAGAGRGRPGAGGPDDRRRRDDGVARGDRARRSGRPARDDAAGSDDRSRGEGGSRREDRGGAGGYDRRRREGGYRRAERSGGRPGRDSGRPQRFDRGPGRERSERTPEHNPGDLRSSNRPDRAKSPEIDADVTGKELDRATQRELDSLDERNRPWVAKHLVMAGRLLDIDPEVSFEHALAASRRGGRLGCVREAVGLTAYAAGHYTEALREFRTYRRITGDNTHLPEMVDSERALGRHAKALELAAEVDPQGLDKAIRAELVMVLSGIHQDLGDLDSALRVLRVPELDRNRGFVFSPRLFRAYADALEESGRAQEAGDWRRQARVAERALGVGEFAEPEIVDFGLDDEAPSDRRPRARDLVPPGSATDDAPAAERSADAGEPSPSLDPTAPPAGAPEDEPADGRDD